MLGFTLFLSLFLSVLSASALPTRRVYRTPSFNFSTKSKSKFEYVLYKEKSYNILTSEGYDIYVVNLDGKTPGIACNAINFVNKYSSSYYSPNNYLILDAGAILSRSQAFTGMGLRSSGNCKSTFQLDEFPPHSTRQIAGAISLLCVPGTENSSDGGKFGAFLKRMKQSNDGRFIIMINPPSSDKCDEYANNFR